MANATVSRLGQADASGDAQALFLIRYAGEVLEQFDVKNVFLDKHTVRQIDSGKSAQFPATGLGDASYHTPGVELVGTKIKHNQRLISIDDQLIADRFIANIDEAMNHYDVRSIYSKDAGRALARAFDRHVAAVGVLAARAAATVSGGDAGSRISDTDAHTSGSSLAASIFLAGQYLDEKNVDEDGRYCFLRPAQYNLLAQTTGVINKDWGGLGSYGKGKVFELAGITCVKTNNLPSTNIATGPVAYQGDFSDTVALVMNASAVGTVKLIDLAVEMQYDIRRQGTLVVAKYAMGHGILRPEAAVEISKANF